MTTASGIVLRHLRALTGPPGDAPDAQLIERFTKRRDEAAFAALVKRHGPLVLGVCRRILRHQQDAEDAFQATFLVLAQKATTITKRASVGSWLYQVAYHMATRSRKRTTNRQKREEQAAVRPPADALDDVTGRELLAVLDDELQNLPENCREALVQCYLQGLTRDEAAKQLGISESTLKRRLEAGKTALRKRLTRRGLALPAALLASGMATAAVPVRLAAATAQAAIGATVVSAPVAALVRSSLRAMSAGPLKTVGAIMLTVALLGAGLWSYAAPAAPPAVGTPPQAAPKGDAPAPRAEPKVPVGEKEETTYSGRVIDPDGKPVAGAKAHLLQWAMPGKTPDKTPPKVWAETDKDGRFSFTAPVYYGEIFVTADGFGPGWNGDNMRSVLRPNYENQVIRLTQDDVPVSGRLLDVQGEPIAGVSIRVFSLKTSSDGSLDKWIAAVKKRMVGQHLRDEEYLSSYFVDDLAHFFPPVTTDKEGRFQLKGIGRERVAAFTIEGPTIETRVVHVVTKPGLGAADLRIPENMIFFGGGEIKELRARLYYPPTFTHTADPGRAVTGVVTDKVTGKPIAGAIVRGEQPVRFPVYYNQTTADKDGHYRLTGIPLPQKAGTVPLGGGYGIVASAPESEPHLAMRRSLPADKDAKVESCDFHLPPAVRIDGQVKDKATGRGMIASVRYFRLEHPLLAPTEESLHRDLFAPLGNQTDSEGHFHLMIAQESGVIGATALGDNSGHYRIAVGADKIKGIPRDPNGGMLLPAPVAFGGNPSAEQLDTLIEIKPEKGATRLRCELELDPGRPLMIQVRDPDGKPLAGAQAYAQTARRFSYPGWSQRPEPAELPVYGLEPGRGRKVLVVHLEKNLAAICELKGDEKGPIALTLQPAGTIVGRFVDDEGKPRKNTDIDMRFNLGDERMLLHVGQYKTDGDGKFRIGGIIPGLAYFGSFMPRQDQPYSYSIFREVSVKGGETTDLGTVKAKRGDQ